VSLIDEALKRAQAAHQGKERPEAGARPWTPVPLPDPTEARRRAGLRAAGVVALALAVAGAAWLLRPAPKSVQLHQGKSERAVRPDVPALPTPLAEVIVAPPSRPVSAKPTLGPAAAGLPAAPSKAAPSASFPSAASASDAPGRPAPSVAALVNGRTYVGSIALPEGAKIELGGIVYSDTNATALVNGRPLGTGAYVEGFTIVRIEAGRLELEGNGLTIFLALGR
jgi:hypothetical protein